MYRKRSKIISSLIIFIFSIFASIFYAQPTNALGNINPTGLTSFLDKSALWSGLSEEQQTIFSQTDNIFYDPTECDQENSADAGEGTYDGIPTAGLSNEQSAFVDKWHDIAAKWSVEYGIPWETVVAQGILESASGTSNFAKNRNNFFGIGAFDSNPDNAYYYDTPAEGWKGYFENIRKTSTYREHGVFKGKTITDPIEYLKAIKEAGYATDPDYVSKVGSLVKAIQERSKKKSWDSSAQLAQKHPEMISNAAKYASGSGKAPSSSSTSSAGISTSSIGANEIAATAIKMAWPYDQAEKANSAPTDEYKKVLKERKINSDGKDCGIFASSVIYASGYDKEIPESSVSQNLIPHFESHSDLYEEIKNWKKEDLKPGDIQAYSNQDNGTSYGHIRIVVEDGGKTRLAHAHLNENTGKITDYLDGKDNIMRVWRPKGSSSSSDECQTPSTEGNNDINKTALELAYPEKGHDKNVPKPEYQKAMEKLGVWKKANDSCQSIGASCDVFVSTVIKYAGIDKDFPYSGPCAQRDYMAKTKKIYEEVPKSGYEPQPGDIQIRCGSGHHSRIVVQGKNGKVALAHASNCDRTGEVTDYWEPSSDYSFFRVKGGIQTSTNISSQSSGAQGSKNLNQVALELAYGLKDPKNKQYKTTATPSPNYAKALDAVKTRTNYDDCKKVGASCDSFVATVIRYAGIDPKFTTALAYQTKRLTSKTDIFEEVTQGYNKDNMQAGDIHINVTSGHHIRILGQTEDGKFHIVEAGHGSTGRTTGSGHCRSGAVMKGEFNGKLGGYRAFRAKENSNQYNPNCVCQVGEQNQNTAVEGGLTDEQAKKLVAAYQKEDGRCNCVDLSNWFIKNMLGLEPVSGNGGDIAYNLAKAHHLEHGSEPRPYAVFGTDGSMAHARCGQYKCGHTGVVVAVNGDEVTTIEAAWGNCGFTGVKKHKKSEFTSQKYGKDYVFTYTDKVLKQDELNKRIK